MISENISKIKDNISIICQTLGKNPEDVILVGVTKYAAPPAIREAIACGITHIGENKVQEARFKFSELPVSEGKITRHMIGHLQTNKVNMALKLFEMIQSLDSPRLAEALNKEGNHLNRIVEALVQVNTSGEKQKHGLAPEETISFLEQLSRFKNIAVLGLMTVAPLTEDREAIRHSFQSLRKLFEAAKKSLSGTANIKMRYLSMGMTNDYKIAIEEGSNMVRIGRAIFQN